MNYISLHSVYFYNYVYENIQTFVEKIKKKLGYIKHNDRFVKYN